MTELRPSQLSNSEAREGPPVHGFAVGDRVRLSSLGKTRNPRTVPTGQIVSIYSRKSGYGSVYVLLDGLTSPRRLHWSYLDLEENRRG
jgi:hypothetical protein